MKDSSLSPLVISLSGANVFPLTKDGNVCHLERRNCELWLVDKEGKFVITCERERIADGRGWHTGSLHRKLPLCLSLSGTIDMCHRACFSHGLWRSTLGFSRLHGEHSPKWTIVLPHAPAPIFRHRPLLTPQGTAALCVISPRWWWTAFLLAYFPAFIFSLIFLITKFFKFNISQNYLEISIYVSATLIIRKFLFTAGPLVN